MLSMKECCACGCKIPQERVDALPGCKYCIACSKQYPEEKAGFMVFGHKTAPELVIVSKSDKQSLEMAQRADRRSR